MIKWIKRLLNKYSSAESAIAASEDWKSLYAKSPIHAETVAASITINDAELKYMPDGYIADTLAELIAKELVRRDLITIEQPDADAPDRRAFTGKIEIVSRR